MAHSSACINPDTLSLFEAFKDKVVEEMANTCRYYHKERCELANRKYCNIVNTWLTYHLELNSNEILPIYRIFCMTVSFKRNIVETCNINKQQHTIEF